jgi:hypothetical protein
LCVFRAASIRASNVSHFAQAAAAKTSYDINDCISLINDIPI